VVSWGGAYWVLLVVFVSLVGLSMADVKAGPLTSWGADVVVPALLYIMLRGLHHPRPRATGLGASAEATAAVLFLGATFVEVSQRYWPQGFFTGVFDPIDVLAYAVGVGACYLAERRTRSVG
jgi:hypothetical protein